MAKGIRMVIACKEDMQKVVDHVRGSVVLHNFLIDDPIDQDWVCGFEEGEDDLTPERVSPNQSNEPDYRRHQELLFYLSELEETTIN